MKRVLSGAIAITMSLSLILAGCGTDSANTGNTTAATSAAAVTDTGTQAETTDPFGKYDPPITAKVARQSNQTLKFPEGDSMDNNVWYREYKDTLGIEVVNDWMAEGTDQYTTKMNMQIATNDLPDILLLTNQSQLSRLVEAGKVADLTDVYAKYAAPLTKELMEEDGGVAQSTATYDGKLYALATTKVDNSESPMLWVREDWRNKVGLPEPKTLEDVFALSKAFSTQDPDGNGKDDTFGIGLTKKIYEGYFGAEGIFNSYGAYPRIWLKDSSGKLVYGSTQPEMKEALKKLQELYKDGQLDSDFVLKDATAVSKDVCANKFGIYYGRFAQADWPLNEIYKADKNSDWKSYPLLGPGGKEVKAQVRSLTQKTFYAVRKDYTNPEALIKLANIYFERSYGKTADDSKYRKNGEFASMHLYSFFVAGKLWNNHKQNINVTKAIDSKDLSVLENSEQKATYESVKKHLDGVGDDINWAMYKMFYGPTSSLGVLNMYRDNNLNIYDGYNGSVTDTMIKKKPTLDTNEETMLAKIITGSASVDEFDKFVQEFNTLGGNEMTQEVNDWFTSQK